MPANTWPEAREQLRSDLEGLVASDSEGEINEALTMYEWPPSAADARLPFGIIIPPPREITRHNGHVRETNFPNGVEIAIALATATGDNARLERLSQRYEAWVDALADKYDTRLTWDGAITVMNKQTIGPIERLPLTADGYIGFVMTFDIKFKTTKTLSA